jgi:polyisoprenoid-binding protein YceI
MTSASGSCDAELVMGAGNKMSSIKNLSFTIPVKTLKSGHKVMDKNTYKALKTSDFPNIAFVLSRATITQTDSDNYTVNCNGKLTIAGTTHETDLVATGKWKTSDKSFLLNGTKKLKMTDYNVIPPTVMMGTIKTGNAISINFNLTLGNK